MCVWIHTYNICIYIYINTCVCVYWYAYCLWCGVQHVHTIMHILQKHVWFSLPNELPLRWSIDELGIPCARWTQWNDKEIHYDFPVEHWPMDIEGFRARLPGVLQLHQGSSVCIWTTPFFATLWVWDLISMGESSSASSSQTPRRNHAFVRVVHIWDHRRVVFNRGMGILSPSPWKVHLAASGDKSNWLGEVPVSRYHFRISETICSSISGWKLCNQSIVNYQSTLQIPQTKW